MRAKNDVTNKVTQIRKVNTFETLFKIKGFHILTKNVCVQLWPKNLTSTLFLVFKQGIKSKYPYYFLFRSIDINAGHTVTWIKKFAHKANIEQAQKVLKAGIPMENPQQKVKI